MLEVENLITTLRGKAALAGAIDPKEAVEAHNLAYRVDTEGPAALSEESKVSNVEDATKKWEAISGITFDADGKKQIDEALRRYREAETERAETAATRRAELEAKSARFKRKRR